MKEILLIPRVKVQNANALSSPYTIGFPAMTAWLGAVHALERNLKRKHYPNIKFKSMGVVCHEINLQTYKGKGDYVYSIVGTSNPLIPKAKPKDNKPKNAERPSFIEEARCHLDVSLIIEYEKFNSLSNSDGYKNLPKDIEVLFESHMKLAGGDILGLSSPKSYLIENTDDLRKLTRKLMPGYCLIERRDLLQDAMKAHKHKDVIDNLIDYLKVYHRCEQGDNEQVIWKSYRKTSGWIVPIATGFQGITPLGIAKHQRDESTPHRFAESIITLGEFIMPYRINDIDHILWKYHFDKDNNLYLCQQNKSFY